MRLGVFLLPPEWDASRMQGYLHHFQFIHLGEDGHCETESVLHENTISPARARTQTAVRTDDEASAPPHLFLSCLSNAPINIKPEGGGGGGRATHGNLTVTHIPRVGILT